MTKNLTKSVRNPNSPEAIQARLNNVPDPTPYEKVFLIKDNKASRVFIDLTDVRVDQRIGYVITGGPRKMNRKLIKYITSRGQDGRLTMTNYYLDTDTRQWIIIRSYLDIDILPHQKLTNTYRADNFPKSSVGNFFGGVYGGVPGQTWRNERRSVDKLREKVKRVHQLETPKIDPDANLDIKRPEDRYHHDFKGTR